jgi:CDP-glucose 4,6-dehydratase
VRMKNLEKFWHGKKVLITGNTGFKGSWLSIWLHSMGATVTGYSLKPNTKPALFYDSGLDKKYKTYYKDIRDSKALETTIHKSQPEIVFHLAAQPLVRDSYEDPLYTYETNVLGTANLLNALRSSSSIKSIVIVTTDKCYQNQEWDWGYRETDALGGHDPYSSSKACAELVTQSFRDSYFSSLNVGLATARAGNVIGGGDWTHNRVVPDVLRAIASKSKLELRNPKAIRPWQHVLEPIYGYLLLAQKLFNSPGKFSSAWNFGPNQEDARTVISIANHLINKSDSKSKIVIKKSSLKETNILKLDITKSFSQLGWKPQLDIDSTLELIMRWNESHQKGCDSFALCLQDISRLSIR